MACCARVFAALLAALCCAVYLFLGVFLYLINRNGLLYGYHIAATTVSFVLFLGAVTNNWIALTGFIVLQLVQALVMLVFVVVLAVKLEDPYEVIEPLFELQGLRRSVSHHLDAPQQREVFDYGKYLIWALIGLFMFDFLLSLAKVVLAWSIRTDSNHCSARRHSRTKTVKKQAVVPVVVPQQA